MGSPGHLLSVSLHGNTDPSRPWDASLLTDHGPALYICTVIALDLYVHFLQT